MVWGTKCRRKICARNEAHNDVLNAGAHEHVGDQLGRDGRPRLVFLVLPRVGEVRQLDALSGTAMHRDAGLTTAVIRLALAILQAWAMIKVSIKAALVGTVEEDAVLQQRWACSEWLRGTLPT
jgi:hypothetical protein